VERRGRSLCQSVLVLLGLLVPMYCGLLVAADLSVASRLAFVKNGDVWTIADDGTSVKQLTSGERSDFGPAWSANRGTIAFIREPSDTVYIPSRVWVMRSNGTNKHRLVYAGPSLADGSSALAYSPNGRLLAGGCKLAGQDKWAVTVLNLATRKSRIVARYTCQNGITSITWKPDSSQLVATIEYGGGGGMLRVDVGHSRLIKNYGFNLANTASWMPHGPYLLCSVWAPSEPNYPTYTRLLKLDGTTVSTLGINQSQPVYSPSGGRYAFLRMQQGNADLLQIAKADGTHIVTILTAPGLWSLAWR
jgi:WD40-like Beta Propeller Repeat